MMASRVGARLVNCAVIIIERQAKRSTPRRDSAVVFSTWRSESELEPTRQPGSPKIDGSDQRMTGQGTELAESYREMGVIVVPGLVGPGSATSSPL